MTEDGDRLIERAARNNADWCDAFCDLHGFAGAFRPDSWTSRARTPRYYPDAVTLARSVAPAQLLSRIDSSGGCSVKDSFADLDLKPWGFEVLFGAAWIHRAAPAPLGRAGAHGWEIVRSDAGLAAWETAWGGDPTGPRAFLPGLLAREDVAIIAMRSSEAIVAGAILNSAAGVTGLSNLFAADVDQTDAFASAAAMASQLWPGQALVGYQAGTVLDAAMRSGFEPIGPLVVWIKP
jgi:hypothetical protein